MRALTLLTAALVALTCADADAAAPCRPGVRCVAPHRRVRPRLTLRPYTTVQPLAPNTRQAPLPRAGFTERPVLPGNAPVPEFMPNNLPPVFAPQPAQ